MVKNHYFNTVDIILVNERGKKMIEIKTMIQKEEEKDELISKNDTIAVMHLLMDDAKIGEEDEDYECLEDIKQQYIEIVKGMKPHG